MRSVRYNQYGAPDVLEIVEHQPVSPDRGQVEVEMEAVAANAIDTVFRRGDGPWRRPLPGTLSGDVVGRIVRVGEGVRNLEVGDRVAGLSEDAFADHVLLDAAWVAQVPAALDPAVATAAPMALPLALRLLRQALLSAGDRVLVTAAAGGIGHLAVQVGLHLGAAQVVGGASAGKSEFVQQFGAVAVDTSGSVWPDAVRELTGGGVDVALDAVGGDQFKGALSTLRAGGRLITYGAISGVPPTVSPIGDLRGRYLGGLSITEWRVDRPDLAKADIDEAVDLLTAGTIRPRVHATYPLNQIVEVHRMLESRQNRGRLVVTQ